MLSAQQLTILADERKLVNEVSLQIQQGEIFGLVGHNGAGKTTLIKALLGLMEVHSGSYQLGDGTLTGRKMLAQVGALIERAPLYNHLSAYDNLKIAAIQYGIDRSRITEVLEIAGLAQEARKVVKKFSLGMKQRLGIGLALFHKPSILILDEPTNGLDPDGILEIQNLLLSINQKFGVTMLIASHHLHELERMVTHIGLMKNGSLVFNDTVQAFRQAGTVQEAYTKFGR